MNRLFLCFCFFSVITLVFSEPSAPLRGASKEAKERSDPKDPDVTNSSDRNDLEKKDSQGSSEDSSVVKSVTETGTSESTEKVPSDSQQGRSSRGQITGNSVSAIGASNTERSAQVPGDAQEEEQEGQQEQGQKEEERPPEGSSSTASTTQSTASQLTSSSSETQSSAQADASPSEPATETPATQEPTTEASTTEKPTTEAPECESSFVMWFSNGVAVTTIYCKEYSIIYTGKSDGQPKPKYLKGKVEKVEVEEGGTIKVNNVALSGISEDSNNPTDNSVPKSMRLLNEDAALQNVDVYSFPIGDREITVKLPNSDQAEKRDKYTLSSGDETFYSGSDNNSKYSIKDNGDLVDSTGKVLLKGDSSSYAIKNIYSVSSLFAILMSVLIF